MDGHAILRLAGGILGLGLFVPMIVSSARAGGAGQSFATWALWAALDSLLTLTLYQQHGNYLLTLGFALGGVVLSAVLLARGGFAWGKLETVISVFVVASLAVWKFSGPRNATLAVTAAICVAGVPGLVEMARKPQPSAGRVWAGYVLANGLAFLGGTAMTVEERLVPGAFTVYSVLMLAASRRRPPPG